MPDDNDNLSSIADYYASQGMSNPQLSYDQNGNPIFQSNKLPVDISNLQDYAATLPVATPNPLPTHETWINPIAKGSLTDALTGLGGGERYQLFPERIVRSALGLPTDVMSGKLGPYSDPYRNGPITDRSGPVVSEGGLLSSFGVKPVGGNDPEDELLQRVQDMAALMGGGGVAGAERGAIGSGPMRQFQKVTGPVESHSDYVYHATNVERANDIAEGGSLNLHKPHEFTDQDAWPDGSTEKRNYFTPNADNTWQFAPEDGQPVLLRVKKGDYPFKKEGTGDLYSTKPVPAEKIEYLDHTGKWNTLKPKVIKDRDGNELTNYHGDPIQPGPDGKLTLYHRTNEDAANAIKNTGKFQSKENTDETFFADNIDSEYGKGFGDYVVAVKVDPKYVRLNDQFPSGENHYTVPNKFLSKANILKSDNEAAAPLAALEKAPVFHSAVENAVNTASLKSAPPQQWLSTIANAKGVKPEELDWTGLNDFLQEQKGPVSKEQIQQHLEGNKVELKEVNKGEYDNAYKRWKELDEKPVKTPDELAEYQRLIHTDPNIGSTKYSKYQLPGGENYREKLLTLPLITSPKAAEAFALTKRMNDGEFNSLNDVERRALFAKRDQLLKDARIEEGDHYKSSHWDEPNVLAHIRMNDRTIEGKKALNIEEIQSDWHQQGREQGYKITDAQKKELESIDNKLTSKLSEGDIGNPDMDAVLKTAVEKKVITSQEAANYKQWSKGENSNIPDAPFKKTWLDLAAKRIIREAAEQGKDVLSWTPGEAQAARYDLSKQVDSIGITPEGKNGEKTHITVNAKSGVHASGFFDKNGKLVQGYDSFKGSEGKNLSDLVGKEVAEKIMNRANNQPPRPTELPEGYHTIIDKNNKGNEWGVIPPDQKHAKSLVGWHPNEEEATRQAINLIHAGKVRENNVLKNIDLKLGGEGMHYFYDKMLPSVLEKLTGQKMKVSNVDQPGGIGQWSYKGPNRSVDDIIKIARNAPSVSIEHQLGDIANAMKDGNDFGTAVEMHGSYHAAKMLGGELTPVKKPVPINYIDLPQSVKDTALHKGFPLFSSGLMLSPVEDNPFAKSKYKLVPVDHNPFKEKK